METPNGKRRFDTVFLNDKEITVKELTVGEILDLMQSEGDADDSLTAFGRKADSFLQVSCGLALEDLKAFAPSQIKMLYEKFREVNQAFFDLARTLRAQEMLAGIGEELKRSLASDFRELLSASSKPATGTSGTTASAL